MKLSEFSELSKDYIAEMPVKLGLLLTQRSLSRDFCTCPSPGTKGQQARENFFVPGKRDSGTGKLFCSETKGQGNVPSRIVPGPSRLLGNPSLDSFPRELSIHPVDTVDYYFFSKLNLSQ